MDLLDFDPFATNRGDRERPDGPFSVIEQLPPQVLKWKTRVHPATKKTTQLIDFSWQRHQADMILDDMEVHTHSWTLQAVKKREALDKSDERDHAQSLFTLDRNATHRTDGRALFNMRTAPAGNATANAIAAAEAALRTPQQDAIGVLIADPNSTVTAADRTVLTSYCELNLGEFNIFDV